MRTLITGGAGFVGSQLAYRLRQRGHDVVVMDNLVRRGSELNLRGFREAGIPFVHGDVRSPEDFVNLRGEFDIVIECSAQPSSVLGYANPLFDITNNTMGLLNVLEYARKRNSGVIFWSTMKTLSGDRVNAIPRKEASTRWVWDKDAIAAAHPHGLPAGFDPDHGFSPDFPIDGGQHSIYGLSKVMADLACQEYANAFDLPVVINRCGVLAGEGQFGKTEQGFVAWWAIAHHFGLPLEYIGWKGKQVRDILFAEDIARLVQLQMERIDRLRGEVFSIGGGMRNSMSLVEATALLEKKHGRSVPTTLDPEIRKTDHCIYVSDIRKAKRVLGWEPTIGLEEGYDRIVRWIAEHEAELRSLYVPK